MDVLGSATWISGGAESFLDPRLHHPDDGSSLVRRSRALKVLQTESDSVRRLLGGLACWVTGVLGAAGVATALWSGAPALVRVVAPLLGIVLLVGSARVGRDVWRAGRRVVDAFVWWTLLPERLPGGGDGVPDWRASPIHDAVQARLFVWQGARWLRIALGALVATVPPAFASTLQHDPELRNPPWQEWPDGWLAVFTVLLFAISWTCTWVVLGGQWRAARAATRRDPVQRRLLGQ